MSRVSEYSNKASVNFAISKAKGKLEELQMKGTNLKKVRKPSDNPLGNIKALELTSSSNLNSQYLKNINFAQMNHGILERSLEEINDVLVQAKEITVAQASDFYDENIRESISKEIKQLRNQLLGIANKQLGNKYIFGGHKTTTKPFEADGTYNGDSNRVEVEIKKNYFQPLSLSGSEVFEVPYSKPLDNNQKNIGENNSRGLASETNMIDAKPVASRNIIHQMNDLENALLTNNKYQIQGLLEDLDKSIDHVIKTRTSMGSVTNSIQNAKELLEKENVDNSAYKSKLIDADVAELFSDISKHQQILNTAYKSSQAILNRSLMDFLR
jgi:flagellar hook-associated protein 3 FlgL